MNQHNPDAIIQRLFLHAERRVGGAAKLGEHLGLRPAELAPYLAGIDTPPAGVLLRAVSLVLDDLDSVMRGHSAPAWHSLIARYRSASRT
jgi:hypothetical protein